jgi:hypothetical protein
MHRTILLLVLAASFAAPAQARDPNGVAVVELFTSEGCSSCPAAESLLNELDVEARASRLPVYALAFHVDYWNYLGWIDRFSTKRFADRQRAYAQARDERSVYTPQMIINGRTAFVGSSAAQARSTIAAELAKPAPVSVVVSVKRTPTEDRRGPDKRARVSVRVAAAPAGSQLHIALVANDQSSKVTRGENRGRLLVHRGVVRDLHSRAVSDGPAHTSFDLPSDVSRDQLEVVAFVSDGASLTILGAARAGL